LRPGDRVDSLGAYGYEALRDGVDGSIMSEKKPV
jgi:hypothetical protein